MASRILTANLSKPLDGATSATIEIDSDTGHLTIDGLAPERVLVGGTLEYFEKEGVPAQNLSTSDGQATLTLKGGGRERSLFRLPWSACGGAYEWQIHVNPAVSADLSAHTGGGNVKLNLAGMALTRLTADSGGGNMAIVLPDNAANLSVLAKTGGGNVTVDVGSGTAGSSTIEARSGAGNVVVNLPSGIAARIQATSGLGKVIVDPAFGAIDKSTYQSPDFDSAANRVEITATSGAGNVVVSTR